MNIRPTLTSGERCGLILVKMEVESIQVRPFACTVSAQTCRSSLLNTKASLALCKMSRERSNLVA